MAEFWLAFKHRFCTRPVVAIMLLGVILLLLTYLIREGMFLEDLAGYKDENSSIWQEDYTSGVLTDEAFARSIAFDYESCKSYATCFHTLLSDASMLYMQLGAFLIAVPALLFHRERRGGFLKFALIRSNSFDRCLFQQGLAVAAAGWLVGLLPLLAVWLGAALLCPTLLPLDDVNLARVLPGSIWYGRFEGWQIVLPYLVKILVCSLQFFFLSLLNFAAALLVQRGIVLLFVPFLFVNLVNLCGRSSGYVFTMLVEGAKDTMSYAPTLLMCLITLVCAMALLKIFVRREGVINA